MYNVLLEQIANRYITQLVVYCAPIKVILPESLTRNVKFAHGKVLNDHFIVFGKSRIVCKAILSVLGQKEFGVITFFNVIIADKAG